MAETQTVIEEFGTLWREGCWIAYYGDWSGMAVFRTEIEALRYAVGNSSMLVKQAPWGQDVRENA